MTPASIILLGATGYVGQAFAEELERRRYPFLPLSRKETNYADFNTLLQLLRQHQPAFLINAAGYTGKPNVDACEVARSETTIGNTLLPQTIAHACAVTDTPWGHVSSGCIYTGAKIGTPGHLRIEPDLTRPELMRLAVEKPEQVHGFTETDEPNFCFDHPPCSFYSGTKALGETAIHGIGQSYLWRLRIPFDERDGPRNYLTKLQRYPKVYDNVNSISHRGDFVSACLDLWDRRAPFGIYNVTNPGYVTSRQVVKLIEKHSKANRRFEFWENDDDFYRHAASARRSNCVLDISKLLAAGVKVRPVEEALEESLKHWEPNVVK